MRRIGIVLTIFLLVSCAATFGQSLGDVARQTRQKEKPKGAARKVVTNEDIPESPDLNPGPAQEAGNAEPGKPVSHGTSAPQIKSAIQAQKSRIAALQAQIDKIDKSIYFVEANAYVNGVQYNQHQVKKQQQVANLRTQLAEQQQKLSDMQDAAKKAGMGSAVYDP